MVNSPANYPHLRLNVIYEAHRAAHTAPLLVKTSKPRKKKVRQKDIEALRDRAESVEGSEVPENIIANVQGEIPIRPYTPDTAGIPPEGFNGA